MMQVAKLWAWLALGLILPTVGATAQQREPSQAQAPLRVPPARWVIDYGHMRCSLVHRLGDDQSPLLLLSSYLGRDEPEIILMRDGTGPLPRLPDRLRVVLLPGGQVAEGRVEVRRVTGGTLFFIRELGEGFIDRFGGSSEVRLQVGERPVAQMRMSNAAGAVRALKACNDDLLRSWGADPVRAAALQRQPKQTAGSISNVDYPQSAVLARQSGVVVTRLTIGVDGRVADCTPVVSSRIPVLDTRTCELLTRRFLFDPALDANGRPVSWPIIRTVTWRMW